MSLYLCAWIQNCAVFIFKAKAHPTEVILTLGRVQSSRLLEGSVGVCSSDRCLFEQEKKSPQKGSPRSRIPRLVLHPYRPKDKGSPLSDSPFSEEEGRECDMSSDHSKRTISSNSFCSGKRFSCSLRTAGLTTDINQTLRGRQVSDGGSLGRSAQH